MRRPRILVASFDAPGRGGAATSSYQLFARMQRDGRDVHYLALVDARNEARCRRQLGPDFANPRRLADACYAILQRPLGAAQTAVATALGRVRPDVVLAVSHLAAVTARRAAPEVPLVLLTAGSAQVGAWLETHPEEDALSALARLEAGEMLPRAHRHERYAMAQADRILVHAPLVRRLHECLYPEHADRTEPGVVSYAEWIVDRARAFAHRARPFEARDVDVLFVASNWRRPVKNGALAAAITAALPGRRIHVLGGGADLPGATHHGLLADPEAAFGWFGRARVVVCPSRLDAEPGVLFEAAALGANPVASANCGNHAVCAGPLRVEDPRRVEAWVACIERGIAAPYPTHLADYLTAGGYDRLMAAVERAAVERPAEELAVEVATRGFAVVRRFLAEEEADRLRERRRSGGPAPADREIAQRARSLRRRVEACRRSRRGAALRPRVLLAAPDRDAGGECVLHEPRPPVHLRSDADLRPGDLVLTHRRCALRAEGGKERWAVVGARDAAGEALLWQLRRATGRARRLLRGELR